MSHAEKKTQVRLSPELAKALKVAGAIEGRPIYSVAEQAVMDYLRREHPRLAPGGRKTRKGKTPAPVPEAG